MIIVKGVSSIQRAIINIKEKDDERGMKGDKELLVEGYGLQKCMITEGLWLLFLEVNYIRVTCFKVWLESIHHPTILLKLLKFLASRQHGGLSSKKFSIQWNPMA